MIDPNNVVVVLAHSQAAHATPMRLLTEEQLKVAALWRQFQAMTAACEDLKGQLAAVKSELEQLKGESDA